jgi:hypothetical protein
MLSMCAGCDRSPSNGGAPQANGSAGRTAAEQQAPIVDRQAPGSENRVPVLSGAIGKLRYRPGCLYLDHGKGAETGLVIPSYVVFDGKRVAGSLKKPTGEPIVFSLGDFVNLTGRVIGNPRDGRYSCDTKQILLADYF